MLLIKKKGASIYDGCKRVDVSADGVVNEDSLFNRIVGLEEEFRELKTWLRVVFRELRSKDAFFVCPHCGELDLKVEIRKCASCGYTEKFNVNLKRRRR